MSLNHKLNKIRTPANPNTKQIGYSIAFSAFIGLTLGFLAKLFDEPSIPLILSSIGSRLGVWIFVATLLSTFSYTPKLASIRVFVFFVSMLISYYLYTVFLLHFFPKELIAFWSVIALFSPILAYIMWFSHGDGGISNILIASPIALILQDGYGIYLSTIEYYQKFQGGDYLISNRDYYNMFWSEIVYLGFIVLILLTIPKNKKQCLIIIPLAVMMLLILVKTNLLKFLFI